MSLGKIADKVVETDVLVVGGGIAGCPAAVKAAEHGLRVTLLEKSKVERSGSAGQGIDHYSEPIPRGMTPEDWLRIIERYGREIAFFGSVPYSDPTMLYRIIANRLWAIEELERLGIPMKWDDGEYHHIDLAFHGGGTCLRVHWQNVKPIMAEAVRKRGVNVLDRTMAVDLLTHDGAVVGALGLDTRSGETIVIRAKATVIATAACSRLYDPETPLPWRHKFNYHWCPASVSGDGWAMAYRAGAELANMEVSERGIRFRDDLTLSYGNTRGDGIEAKRLTWDGEEIARKSSTADVWTFNYSEFEKRGRDPFYYSLDHLPDDFHKRIEVAYVDERMLSFEIAEERGFNPKTHWYEMSDVRPLQLNVPPGINVDSDFRTTLRGLYAIGDCVAGLHNVACASTAGFLVGDSIHDFVRGVRGPEIDEDQVESLKRNVLGALTVKDGTESVELECTVRYLCTRYVGVYKAEGKLREGLRRLGSLRRVFLPKLMAKNPHQLMRCLEVRNIVDVAEAHIQACLARKESRGRFLRLDYPERDPSLDEALTYSRMEKGQPVVEMRRVTPLNMELREER